MGDIGLEFLFIYFLLEGAEGYAADGVYLLSLVLILCHIHKKLEALFYASENFK